MRKFLLKAFLAVLFISFSVAGLSFSETASASVTNFSDLTLYEKMNIYNQQKYSLEIPILYGSLIGFGTGSFVQNNWLGGLTGLTADILSCALIIWGASITPSWREPALYQQQNTLLISGSVVLALSRAFQIIWPVVVAEQHNNELMVKLGISTKF